MKGYGGWGVTPQEPHPIPSLQEDTPSQEEMEPTNEENSPPDV